MEFGLGFVQGVLDYEGFVWRLQKLQYVDVSNWNDVIEYGNESEIIEIEFSFSLPVDANRKRDTIKYIYEKLSQVRVKFKSSREIARLHNSIADEIILNHSVELSEELLRYTFNVYSIHATRFNGIEGSLIIRAIPPGMYFQDDAVESFVEVDSYYGEYEKQEKRKKEELSVKPLLGVIIDQAVGVLCN